MSDDSNNNTGDADSDESDDPTLTTTPGELTTDDHAPRTGADSAFTVANDAASEGAT